MSVLPSTINGTELSPQELCDALFMRYGIALPDLPDNCDGCEAHFTLYNMLLVLRVASLYFAITKYKMNWCTW
jgi:hypothetical protein